MGPLEIIILVITIILCSFIIGFIIIHRKNYKKGLDLGCFDARLVYEAHEKELKQKKHKGLKIALNVTADIILVSLGAILILGTIDRFVNVPTTGYKTIVVATGSMSKKHENNTYLFENHIDNQIQVNDLIFVKKIDKFEDIKMYDVICYKNEKNQQIIHRVVEIHDDYIKTRGDANEVNDSIDIKFEDIVGRYNNVRIPLVGNFVFFVSSFYGLVTISSCFLLLIVYLAIKNNISKLEDERLTYLLNNINGAQSFVIYSTENNLKVINDNYELINIEEDKQIEKPSVLRLPEKNITLSSKGE